MHLATVSSLDHMQNMLLFERNFTLSEVHVDRLHFVQPVDFHSFSSWVVYKDFQVFNYSLWVSTSKNVKLLIGLTMGGRTKKRSLLNA